MPKHKSHILTWKKLDPEARWGLKAKRFTAVGLTLPCVVGAMLTAIFYLALHPLHVTHQWQMVDMFFHGGPENRSTIPYYTVYLACTCLAFLLVKWRKLKLQRQALKLQCFPNEDYELSPMNAQSVLDAINSQTQKAADFMLLWRVTCALGNLKNIGNVSDISAYLNNLAQNDADFIENSYTVPKGIIWAIPVLGFIGTVLGLSQAVGGFGHVVAAGADLDTLKSSLNGVTGGLAIAFETTLIALVAALVIQLLMTLLQSKEEEFLDECNTFCQTHITSKLKLLDVKHEQP